MLKSLFITVATFIALAANAVTEQEYLAKNKTYTDNLLSFYAKEEKNNKQLVAYKADKKTSESDLKKASSTLSSTTKQLTDTQALLASLKDKQLNKTQLENNLNTQKQQNLSTLTKLNGQISNTNNQLSNINFDISQLQNEMSLFQQKMNTQEQLVNLAGNNISKLNQDIQFLKQDMSQNNNQISSLEFNVMQLNSAKNSATDPSEKQQIQNQIDNKRNQIQQLNQENNFAQSSINSKEIQKINEQSQWNQANSQLSSLQIQANGKQSEINAQVSVQNQLSSSLSNLKSQQASLIKNNKGIDAELDLLANLPAHIATAESDIVGFTSQKAQQESALNSLQTKITTVTSALNTLQTQVDADKVANLASEKDHDAVLKDFLSTITPMVTPVAVVPALPGELAVSIDSLTVTTSIAQSKDWSVFKGTSATLGASVCAAATQMLDTATGVLSELLVIKIINPDNSFSSPFILTTHSMIPDLVVKGQLKTDKSKAILLPLLQSPVANEKALLSRYSDSAKLIASLKTDNSTKVEFTIPGSPVVVPFSLKGSSAMINALEATCKN